MVCQYQNSLRYWSLLIMAEVQENGTGGNVES